MMVSETPGDGLPDWFRAALECPICRAPLRFAPGTLTCAGGHVYPCDEYGAFDFRHARLPDGVWAERQRWMEREYEALLDDGDHAAVGFENDFGGIAALLQDYRGRILDIGGGNGVTRHWLHGDEQYVLAEPSRLWRDTRWSRFSSRFPGLARPCLHVRTYAESLPFAAGTFDIALFLWSLNHVAIPAAAVAEALRVLTRGGRLLAVLEDAEPSWTDLGRRRDPYASIGRSAQHALAKLLEPLRGWPVQRDHVAVPERVLLRAGSARLLRREWRGLYLTVELQKI